MIEQIIKRLKKESSDMEDLGQCELACGLLAAIHIIEEEFQNTNSECNDEAQTQLTADLHNKVIELQAKNQKLEITASRVLKMLGKYEAVLQTGALAVSNFFFMDKLPPEQAKEGLKRVKLSSLHDYKCPKCEGVGYVRGVCSRLPCIHCDETGIDPTKFVEAINMLTKNNRALISRLDQLAFYVFNLAYNEDEKKQAFSYHNAQSMIKFYADCRGNWRGD